MWHPLWTSYFDCNVYDQTKPCVLKINEWGSNILFNRQHFNQKWVYIGWYHKNFRLELCNCIYSFNGPLNVYSLGEAFMQRKKKFYYCTKNEVFHKDFFNKCDQISRKLRILSHLLNKSLMENFIFLQCTETISSYINGQRYRL